MYKSLPIFFVCIFAFTLSFGQNMQLEKSIDSIVSPQFNPNEPGVAILIAQKGKVIYEKAFGSANIELNVPLQPDMIFRIGSVTKQFTAVGILKLVEDGKLSLQDSVQKYVKEFPSKGYTITIENLLTHTSGIPDYANADTVNPYIEREDFTPQKLMKYFKNLPLEFKPGTKYNYSNSGYVLLGLIIEAASGKSYHKYMEENIIKLAGLTHTFYANELTIVPKRVMGYKRDWGFYENTEYQTISLGYACGDLLSNVGDLYKWNNALLHYKVIKKESLEKAFTPFKLNDGTYTKYGYGWFIDDLLGSKNIHHEGQMSGFITTEKYFPTEDIYVVTLTNLKSPEDTTEFSSNRFRLFENIGLLALNKKIVASVFLPQNVLDSYIGVYKAAFQKKRTFTIFKKDGQLFADFGPGNVFALMPQSDTKFSLPDVIYKGFQTTFTFFKTNGITTKLISTQDKDYEWIKIK
jgi:CubicO group peptidase (beta-lactamase class C family)